MLERVRHAPLGLVRVPGLRLGIETWPTLLLFAVYVVGYLQFALQLFNFPFDLDQGEGYDAWSAWLINLGQLPYSTNAEFPYYSSNYPPLWSYLVSLPMAWLGPGLAPARMVSTLATLATAVVLGVAAYRLSVRRPGARPKTGRSAELLAGALAAGFFLASPYVFHTTPLARVNSLALLCAVTSLALLEVPTPRNALFGSVALVAALFTKPTTVDAVIAALASVALRRPRSALLVAAVTGGVGLVGLAALMIATRGAFWLNVVAGNANPFDLQQLSGYLSNFSVLHCVLLTTAAAQAVWMVRRRCWSPWLTYGLTSSVAALGVAKWGAGESYFLGVIAAASVLSALWIARFFDSLPSAGRRWALGSALFVQALLLSHAIVSAAVPWLPDRGPQSAILGRAPSPDDAHNGALLVAQIRGAHGLALSEDPSFAVVAGQPIVANATHLRNLHQAGLWDAAPLVSDLRAHKYAIVILDAELYPEPVLTAIGEAYFLDRVVAINGATYHVFLPGTQ